MEITKENVDGSTYNFMANYADTWWDDKGPMFTLHKMNAIRVPYVADQLDKYGKIKDNSSLHGIKVLEVGCGPGVYTEALAKYGANIVGIDPVEVLIDSARNHLKTQDSIKDRVKYYCETIEEHSEKFPNFYDVVVCSEVMEHVENKKALVKACARALKPGGDFIMTTPNKTILSFIFVIIFAEYICGILEKGSHQWSWFIHHEDMKKVLRDIGLRTVNVQGLNYFPIIKKFILADFKANSYILHAIKENYKKYD